MKIKLKSIYTLLIFDIFLISLILTAYQLRYIETSFKVDSGGYAQKVKIFDSSDTAKASPFILSENAFIENEVIQNSGYTISFFIKTLAEKARFFNTSNSEGGGSIYWNIDVVDGKIQTAKLISIDPLITGRKINDGNWHHILIIIGNNHKIYIDNKLETTTSVTYRPLEEKWLNFTLGTKGTIKEDGQQVYLKDIFFINKNIPVGEVNSFSQYFINKGFSSEIIRTFLLTFGLVSATFCLLIFLIKKRSSNSAYSSITEKIISISPLFALVSLSLWTSFTNKIAFFALLIFLSYILKHFPNILPNHIKLLAFAPTNFFLTFFKLFLRNRKKLPHHLLCQTPETYFIILFCIAVLLTMEPPTFGFIP